MNILIAVEQELDAKMILDFVANYRWPPKAKIVLLHVLDPFVKCAPERRIQVQAFLEDIERRVRALSKVLDVSTVIEHDHPVPAIRRMLDNLKADMLVMGHLPGRRQVETASVSRALAISAPCSVVVIKPPQTQTLEEVEEELEPVFTA